MKTTRLCEATLEDWLYKADPGDQYIYYEGHLAFDRLNSRRRHLVPSDTVSCALRLAEMNKLALLQYKKADHQFTYIAVKLKHK